MMPVDRPARPPLPFDVRGLAPTLVSVDALARLQLAARRRGRELVLRHASRELAELIALAGLADALRLEPGGQPEEREEPLGVEEERQLDDPAV
jgi:hypothetical protein